MNSGLFFSKSQSEKFRISSGVGYTYGKVDFCPICFEIQILFIYERDFQMIAVPVYQEFALGKILYLTGGPVLDFQQSEGNNISDQSDLGYLVGFGARTPLGKFDFSLFPNYKRHGVVPFEEPKNSKFILQELGVQFGIGFNF